MDSIRSLIGSNASASLPTNPGPSDMLAIVEQHLSALRNARNAADLTRLLHAAAESFGFRSAYVVEYASPGNPQQVIDTNPARIPWWSSYFAEDLRPSPRQVTAMLGSGALLHFEDSRFDSGSEDLHEACRANDVVNVTSVPISQDAELVGVVGFCGEPNLDPSQETALQIIAYTVFVQCRAERGTTPNRVDTRVLTPREKEVLRHSADGMTSAQIATTLGMSARTANQHIDNVAAKLGTRNRAHTVAEVIRNRLLD